MPITDFMTAALSAESLPQPPEDLSCGLITLRYVQIVPGNVELDLVPAYHFRILTPDGTDLGHINFRVGDTGHIRNYAGHIGFAVAEPFRGHGYARLACQALARFVRTVYPEVIITCDPDNFASRRTIERLGAEFLGEMIVSAHDAHLEHGTRRKRRYRWVP